MAAKKVNIVFEGPFFKLDPRKQIRRNKPLFMERVAESLERAVQGHLAGSAEAAATRPYVVGRTHALGGKRWIATARVSVSTVGLGQAEAIRRQAIAAGRHNPVTAGGRNIGRTRGAEGKTHAFRDSKRAATAAAKANVDKLIEGLN